MADHIASSYDARGHSDSCGQAAKAIDRPRELILQRSKETRISLERLSEAIGKNPSYIQQFIHRGSPRALPEDARIIIAERLKIDPALLRDAALSAAIEKRRIPVTAPPTPIQDVPLHQESAQLVPATALEWLPRPGPFEGVTNLAAVLIDRPRGRLCPGDVLFYRAGYPARRGDLVVVTEHDCIRAIGELLEGRDGSVTVDETSYDPSAMRISKAVLIILA